MHVEHRMTASRHPEEYSSFPHFILQIILKSVPIHHSVIVSRNANNRLILFNLSFFNDKKYNLALNLINLLQMKASHHLWPRWIKNEQLLK